jgi:hypothetical protein
MQRLGRKVRHDSREERRIEQARESVVDGTGVVGRRIGRALRGDRADRPSGTPGVVRFAATRLTRFDMSRR